MKNEEHKRLRWSELNGTVRMEQQMKKASIICDEALLSIWGQHVILIQH